MHRLLWLFVPVRPYYSNAELLLMAMGFTPLFLNFVSMTSKKSVQAQLSIPPPRHAPPPPPTPPRGGGVYIDSWACTLFLEVMLTKFTNSGVKPIAINKRSSFE